MNSRKNDGEIMPEKLLMPHFGGGRIGGGEAHFPGSEAPFGANG